MIGNVTEIDETVIIKRKYSRGRIRKEKKSGYLELLKEAQIILYLNILILQFESIKKCYY